MLTSYCYPRRTGAILLVVLGLLALFALVAVAFVVVARQHLINSRATAQIEAHRDPPSVLLNEAVLQAIRGTYSPSSVVADWSLLEDMYGPGETGAVDPNVNDGGGGTLPAVAGFDNAVPANAQIIKLAIRIDLKYVPTTAYPNGYFNGRVLTMLTGAARGRSTRIVGFEASPVAANLDEGLLWVTAFEKSPPPAANDRFLINGRPFNGPGFGFPDPTYADPTFHPTYAAAEVAEFNSYEQDGLLDALHMPGNVSPNPQWPWALLPNHTDPEMRDLLNGEDNAMGTADDYKIYADEDYDAPDYQNMSLAMRISPGPGKPPIVVRPSFHDPALVNYWRNRYITPVANGGEGGDPLEWQDENVPLSAFTSTAGGSVYLKANSLKRKIFMRPLVEDHPNFAAVNPFFDPTNPNYEPGFIYNPAMPNNLPPWDVDNDGDGIRDSVWVDIGLPVQLAANGQEYKPLVAYLIIDMDGKLNINVHGTTSQLTDTNPLARDQLSFAPLSSFQLYADPTNGTDNTILAPLGMGMSVAEVNLSGEVDTNMDGVIDDWILFRGYPSFYSGIGSSLSLPLEAPEYVQVLHGRPHTNDPTKPLVPGRYGETHLLDPANNSTGQIDFPQAGITHMDDDTPCAPVGRLLNAFASVKSHLRALDLRGDQLLFSPHSLFRSPPDLDGDGFVILGRAGHPLYGPASPAPLILDTPVLPRDPSGLFAPNNLSQIGFDMGFGGVGGGTYGIAMDSTGGYLNSFGWPSPVINVLNMGEGSDVGSQREAIDDPMELNVFLRGSERRMPFDVSAHQVNSVSTAAAVTPNDYANAPIDEPYTAEDLEWILRPYDADSTARGSRLAKLAPFFATDIFRRSIATTDSWDVPSPSVTVPQSLAKRLQSSTNPNLTAADRLRLASDPHLVDLLLAVLKNKIVTPITPAQLAQINLEIAKMLPPSLVAGLRFDINRPFGNGLDDNDNGVVDEPFEWSSPERLWVGSGLDSGNGIGNGVDFDHDRDADFSNTPHPRYHFARYLYVLAMLLADVDSSDPTSYRIPLASNPAGDKPNDPLHYELTARRIAQWAVNVVDFRDPDAIMTGFEFDLYPFDGWHVNGDLVDNDPQPAGATRPQRAVVWGCERPELLITETIAFHDRGTDDTKQDDNAGLSGDDKFTMAMGGMDDDFDQVRRPQGSVFIELYNPWNGADPRDCPAELYSFIPNAGSNPTQNPTNVGTGRNQDRASFPTSTVGLGGLDLNRLAQASSTSTRAPVWRLLICQGTGETGHNDKHIEKQPNTASQEPWEPDLTNTGAQPMQIERVVWFVTQSQMAQVKPGLVNPSTLTLAEKVNSFGLPPGAVVYYNTLDTGTTGPENDVTFLNITQEFLVRPGQYAVVGSRATTNVGEGAPPDAQIQLHGTSGTYRGSIPNQMLRARNNQLYTSLTPPPPAAPDDIKLPTSIVINAPDPLSISEPLPGSAQAYPAPTNGRDLASPANASTTASYTVDYATPYADTPLDKGRLPLQNGTHLRFKTVYLQRLANPLLPHHLKTNPYRTVDWMHIDLTIFNSITSAPDPSLGGALPSRFASRTRMGRPSGIAVAGQNLSDDNAVWTQQTIDPPNAPITSVKQSLGYINDAFSGLFGQLPAQKPWDRMELATGLGQEVPFVEDGIGTPRTQPFPWLTWNDRPFANNMELLLVPNTSSARLLWEYTVRHANDKDDAFKDEPRWMNSAANPAYPFSHLMNFFVSNEFNATPPTAGNNHRSNFHRILEFVQVPSRFSGTQTMLNPEVFGSNTLGPHPFHPPFNYISTYREPGRVNINTIYDDGHTWAGVMNRFDDLRTGGTALMWDKIVRSRRGYEEGADAGSANQLRVNVKYPSMISNPFRSAASNFNVPPIDPTGTLSLRKNASGFRDIVDGTLMRRDPDDANDPLFAFESTSVPYNNTNRNPYFRYQAFQKLGNVLTTRSNVYAIWVTVGFFEVTRGQVDTAHPDGYYLGPEMGSATGDIERHRSFSIYDRSVPVGFQRGEDHNVMDGMLLHHTLE